VLASKQKPDKQDQRGNRDAAARSQKPSDGDRVGAACRIVAVTQQADVISQCPDNAVTGVDDGKTNGGRIESKARESARNAAVRCDHESRCGVRKLVASTIIHGGESQGPAERADGVGIAAQKSGRLRHLAAAANLCALHASCVGGRILGIEPDHDQAEILGRPQPAAGERIRGDRDHRTTQRLAGVVGQHKDSGRCAQPRPQRFRRAIFALQPQIQRQLRLGWRRHAHLVEVALDDGRASGHGGTENCNDRKDKRPQHRDGPRFCGT